MAKKEFSAKQIQAIELLASAEHNVGEIARCVKTSRTTLQKWRNQRSFIDAVIHRARELVREKLPELYSSAVEQAIRGKHAYFKTLLEHVDRLEEMDKNTSEKSITFKWSD